MINLEHYNQIKETLPSAVKLVAVSKMKSIEDITALYQAGQRCFGENKAQELKLKREALPHDIEWHFIGHLQSNKIKYIAPFVALIHSIDSYNLLQEVNKQAIKYNRIIPCLLQFHIAQEDAKFGFSWEEAIEMLNDTQFSALQNIEIQGIMGMATFTDNQVQISHEFHWLHHIFQQLKSDYFASNEQFKEISMGMTGDYLLAIAEKSTMVRIGSAIFEI
ncbi:MAG: YggS family pyridoxal phosphate-dependent enzyme [Bacteroidales bacterium]|jgi:pyridoxal phosphate enzyme (YggS family)|nr:YggS family pyridoxal phosphate-dependent enzyme [Bacteroidales bacterium]